MKKILIAVIVLLFAIPMMGQGYIQTCRMIGGYWDEWKDNYNTSVKGYVDNFVIYESYRHPSDYCLKVVIKDFSMPDKKTRRMHMKNDKWYVYSGYIEYYALPSSSIGDYVWRFPEGECYDTKINKKNLYLKRIRATIKIAPYKDRPRTYNIWFSDYAVGISFK